LSIFVFTVVIILLRIQVSLSSKITAAEDDLTSLESGFEAIKPSLSFRSPFFLLASLFVLFDLEIVLLFPSIYTNISVGFIFNWALITSVIFLTLLIEWAWYGLKWHV